MDKVRFFDDNGCWTKEGVEFSNYVTPIVASIFKVIEDREWEVSPRDVAYVIESEANMTCLERVLMVGLPKSKAAYNAKQQEGGDK